MNREKHIELLFELIKNSKRSDRDLARMLGMSQPSVTRQRKVFEKEAIKQYTVIPNLSYLGFDIIAFTFVLARESLPSLIDKGKEWAKKQPNVLYASTGQGLGATGFMVSVHKDYADFARFQRSFRREWGQQLQEIKTFIISIKGDETVKQFSFNYLADAYRASSK